MWEIGHIYVRRRQGTQLNDLQCSSYSYYFIYFKLSFLSCLFQDNFHQQQQQMMMMGMGSQTGTSSSLATPPSTVHPMRQSSIAPPPQRVKSQTSHQLSVSAAAASTPPTKTRPPSGNLLQSPESSFGGRQPAPRQQLSVKDTPAPGLPHQQSSVRESQAPQGGPASAPQQAQQQPQQQHLLKPTISKQVRGGSPPLGRRVSLLPSLYLLCDSM